MMSRLRLIIVCIVAPVLLPVSLAVGQVVQELSLKDCIRLAEQQNTSWQQLDNLELIRKQRLKMARTGLIPQISASAGANELIQNSTVVFTDNLLPTSEVNGARTSGTQASVNASFGLMNFGQTIMNVRSVRYRQDAERMRNIGERNTVVLTIAQAYYDCVANDEMLMAVRQQMQASENVMTIAQKRLALGETDSTDYYQAMISYNVDFNALRSLEIARKQRLDDLKILIGSEISSEIILKSNILLLEGGMENENLPNLTVKALESEWSGMKVDQKASLWNIIPELSLYGGYGYSNQSFQNGVVRRNTAVGPSYGISVSYDFGGAKNAIHERKVRQMEADNLMLQIKEQSSRVKSEQEILKQSIGQHRMNMESSQTVLNLSERTLKNTLLKYEHGAVTLTELRTAQAQRLNAKIEFKRAIIDYNLAQLNLLSKMNKLTNWESILP